VTSSTSDAAAGLAGRNMALETHKRDGSWVNTPVNPVREGDRVFFRTWTTSGKVKRLRNDPRVRVAPSRPNGHPTGPFLEGRATPLAGADAEHAAHLVNRRFPLVQGVFVRGFHRLRHLETVHYVISDLAPLEGS
jgi:PPOX class probable F420-dependent enzyme